MKRALFSTCFILLAMSALAQDPPATLPIVKGLVWVGQADPPSTPYLYQQYKDSDDGLIYEWNGSAWVVMESADNQAANEVPYVSTPTNYTPTANDVAGHFAGVDAALGMSGGGDVTQAGNNTFTGDNTFNNPINAQTYRSSTGDVIFENSGAARLLRTLRLTNGWIDDITATLFQAGENTMMWTSTGGNVLDRAYIRTNGLKISSGLHDDATPPASTLDVDGTVTATLFTGSGANLTDIGTSALDDNAVSKTKLLDGAVTLEKLEALVQDLINNAIQSNSTKYLGFDPIPWAGAGTQEEFDALPSVDPSDLFVITNKAPMKVFTGSVLDLSGYTGVDDTAEDTAIFTLGTDQRPGAYCAVLVNRATAPTIMGATEVANNETFAPNKKTRINVTVDVDGTVYYSYRQLEP